VIALALGFRAAEAHPDPPGAPETTIEVLLGNANIANDGDAFGPGEIYVKMTTTEAGHSSTNLVSGSVGAPDNGQAWFNEEAYSHQGCWPAGKLTASNVEIWDADGVGDSDPPPDDLLAGPVTVNLNANGGGTISMGGGYTIGYFSATRTTGGGTCGPTVTPPPEPTGVGGITQLPGVSRGSGSDGLLAIAAGATAVAATGAGAVWYLRRREAR
jgi:hypothetical protein